MLSGKKKLRYLDRCLKEKEIFAFKSKIKHLQLTEFFKKIQPSQKSIYLSNGNLEKLFDQLYVQLRKNTLCTHSKSQLLKRSPSFFPPRRFNIDFHLAGMKGKL